MNVYQETRIQKALSEPFYVLDVTNIEGPVTKVKASGSKQDVYTINLTHRSATVSCNCPDIHARKHQVLCKHICFILLKVGKLQKGVLEHGASIGPIHFQTILDNFQSIWSDSAVVNPDLIKRYKQLVDKGTIVPRNIDDICVICFDSMTKDTMKTPCNVCLNGLHTLCFEQWTKASPKGKQCPFCRSTLHKDSNGKYLRI